MRIAFAGASSDNCGTSMNTVSVAAVNAIISGKRNLIICAKGYQDRFLSMLNICKADEYDADTGLDAVIRSIIAGRNVSELLESCTTVIWENRLEILSGNAYRFSETYENETERIVTIILNVAENIYDNVFIICDMKYHALVKLSELVIYNTMQNYSDLDKTVNSIDDGKSVLLISKYDPESICNLKNIQRRIKNKHISLFYVPYSVSAMDASSLGKIMDFILQNIECDRDDSNYYYISAVKSIAEYLEVVGNAS